MRVERRESRVERDASVDHPVSMSRAYSRLSSLDSRLSGVTANFTSVTPARAEAEFERRAVAARFRRDHRLDDLPRLLLRADEEPRPGRDRHDEPAGRFGLVLPRVRGGEIHLFRRLAAGEVARRQEEDDQV